MSVRRVRIHETTLRDGEQTPGVSFFREEKLRLARGIARMLPGCILDAGYPAISDDEYRAVELIAGEVAGVDVFCVSRAIPRDLAQAWEAVKRAEAPRVCSIIPVSPLLMQHKMHGASPDQTLKRAVEAVKILRDVSSDAAMVDFALEDTTRADVSFACEVTHALYEAGTKVVFVCDSMGVSLPAEFADLVRRIKAAVPGVELAAHTHNDFGLALANVLAAMEAGASVLSSSMNGLGERAGNAATEELVVALLLRKDHYAVDLDVDTSRIRALSRMVAHCSGIHPHAVKPVVGAVAVAVRETGPQVDGIFTHPATYEGIPPELLGLPPLPDGLRIVVGKKSSRGAIAKKLEQLGLAVSEEEALAVFRHVKDLSRFQKVFTDDDLREIVASLREDALDTAPCADSVRGSEAR